MRTIAEVGSALISFRKSLDNVTANDRTEQREERIASLRSIVATLEWCYGVDGNVIDQILKRVNDDSPELARLRDAARALKEAYQDYPWFQSAGIQYGESVDPCIIVFVTELNAIMVECIGKQFQGVNIRFKYIGEQAAEVAV